MFNGILSQIPMVHADQALVIAQADKARLESELATLEQEIAQKQQELNAQKGQSVSLSRDIAILTTQINKSKLDIRAKNIMIQQLGGEIVQKNQTIESLTTKIETEKESLAQLIRKDRELDNKSLVEFILSQDTMSQAYGDIDAFASLKLAIKNSVDEINQTKNSTETEKKSLEIQKNQQTDIKVQLETAAQQVQRNEATKQQLLSISKNKEKTYQEVLAEKAARRAEILAVLFNLRDASAIPFGIALTYANEASKITNVAPAFILAIITQESNLGTDQGSCYVTNMETGAGVSSKSGRAFKNVMKPSRDIGPFTRITTALGRDPTTTLVSCPIISAGPYSWGGAMGPAQFIPSTWDGISSSVAKALNISAPDPWNPRDAFMASALFLEDLGGVGDSYTAQIRAACRYYGSGGSTCAYGRQVMAKVKNIQTEMIDPLQN
ncbi:MAG: lytic murein transglycosylase [Patescibacteria group bacterium]|nr:lytic murein transglycosylase [Patescibacteria group bacterium]